MASVFQIVNRVRFQKIVLEHGNAHPFCAGIDAENGLI
jgi:hypothetical protein